MAVVLTLVQTKQIRINIFKKKQFKKPQHKQYKTQYIKKWPEDSSLEPKHVASYVLITIYVLRLTE